MDEILNKLWKQNEPNTIIDSSFVESVIKPAMEEYARQEVKNCVVPAISDSFCYICKNQLTYFEIEKNICTKCGNSPCPTTKKY